MKKYIFLSAALLLLFTASCSNDDNSNEQKEETQGVFFTITEEGFGADTELTRSETTAKPQIIDAGDCEAEVSIESALLEKQAATRAVTTPVHYTIRAYYGGVKQGELKGTFTSTGFTPDAGYNAYMQLGRNKTYTFICFNDKVTPNGSNLDVTLANAKDARIGRQQIALTTVDQSINLSSKHAGCRIQTKVIAKKDIPTALTSTIESIGATIPQTVSYDPVTNTYTTTATTTMAPTANNSPASTETPYDASNYGQNYSYTSPAPYFYFLPGMDAANLKLNNLSGTIFWKPFNMNISKLSTTSKLLVANGSYAATIKMKPQYTYLMSDGTTGFFKETTQGGGSKTPIALVIDANQRMAIALKNANGGAPMQWCSIDYSTTNTNVHGIVNVRKAFPYTGESYRDPTSGKDETYNASYTTPAVTGNQVKGQNSDFLAFYAAAHYNPGVVYTGSPTLQWYLPSANDWMQMKTVAFWNMGPVIYDNQTAACYLYLFDTAFTQVGGNNISNILFWTSTEVYPSEAISYWMEGFSGPGTSWKNNSYDVGNKVRAFVTY